MTVVHRSVGAVLGTSARVAVTVSGAGDVRVAVADNPGMSGPAFYGPTTPDAQGATIVPVTGLTTGTRYWYQAEYAGALDTAVTGQLFTAPPAGVPASFEFGAATCAGSAPQYPGVGDVLAANRLSNHPVYDHIRARGLAANWPWFWHGGDLHYYDLGSGNHGIVGGSSLANFRRAYDDVFTQPRQAQLYREIGWAYTWHDHCLLGNDLGGADDPTGAANAAQVYRERVPHYPLGEASGAVYYSWEAGRVLLIASDDRYAKAPNTDPPGAGKTMLGPVQKAWMENILATSQAEALIWLMPGQWLGTAADTWADYIHERAEMTQMFGDHGWLHRMCAVSGDGHQLGISSGASNPNGGFPVAQFSPLDSQSTAAHEARWDVGRIHEARGCWGTVRVDDLGTDGVAITLTGYVGDTPHMWHTFHTSGSRLIPDGPPSHVLAL